MEIATTKLSKFNNIVFLELSILIISFIWINYYLRNFKFSFIISIIVLIVFSIIFFTIRKRRLVNNKKKTQDIELKENIKLQLKYGKSDYVNKFLLQLLNISTYKEINKNHFYDELEKRDIFICFNNTNFCETDFYNLSKSNNIIIISLENYHVNNLLSNYNFTYYNYDSIFSICCEKKLFPNTNYEIIKNKKYTYKEILQIMLNKSVSKKYFLIGILLMFYSIFSRFNIYYIVFSTFTILLAVYSRFNYRFNQKNS